MSEFVSIPVPKEHAGSVYRLLSRLTSDVDVQPNEAESDEAGEFEEWSTRDLKFLSDSPRASVRRVARVMDELSETPDVPVALSDLSRRLNLSRAELQGAFSGFSRWVRATWEDDDSWPLAVTYGAARTDEVVTENYYSIPETTAARWRSLRGLT